MIFLVLFIVKPWLIFAREHGNYSNIKADKLVVVKLLPTLKHVFSHQKPKKFYRITNISLNVHGLHHELFFFAGLLMSFPRQVDPI